MIVFSEVELSVVIAVLLSLRHRVQVVIRAVKNIISAPVYNLLTLQMLLFVQVFRKALVHWGPPWRAVSSICFNLWKKLLVGQCWDGSINSIASLFRFRGMLYRNHQKRHCVLLSRQKVYYLLSSCISWRFRIGPLQRTHLQLLQGIGRSAWASFTLVHHLFILWFHHLVHWDTLLTVFKEWQSIHLYK